MNKIKVDVNGVSFTLDFDTMGHYELFHEAVGFDILEMANKEVNASMLSKIYRGLLYAGYFSECLINNVQPKFSKDEMLRFGSLISKSEGTRLFNEYMEMQTTDVPGEKNGQLTAEQISTV